MINKLFVKFKDRNSILPKKKKRKKKEKEKKELKHTRVTSTF